MATFQTFIQTFIQILTVQSAQDNVAQLSDLLRNAVEAGASIGFVLPLSTEEVTAYWQKVIKEVDAGEVILLAAMQGERMVGTAQLGLESRANGNHRAEVRKVMVHTSVRGQGIGKQLMFALEEAARSCERILLFLDTRHGDTAERLYASTGYTYVGSIPHYARSTEGQLEGNAIYYKLLV
jgi:acetyltransferase